MADVVFIGLRYSCQILLDPVLIGIDYQNDRRELGLRFIEVDVYVNAGQSW